MNNKLQELKEAIQKANPEIMELKFGCRIITNQYRHFGEMILLCKDENINGDWKILQDKNIFYQNESKFEILGRPIRLGDVLLAINIARNDKQHGYSIRHTGRFYRDNLSSVSDVYMANWNLKDDNLDHQSEETINFLYDLLVSPPAR